MVMVDMRPNESVHLLDKNGRINLEGQEIHPSPKDRVRITECAEGQNMRGAKEDCCSMLRATRHQAHLISGRSLGSARGRRVLWDTSELLAGQRLCWSAQLPCFTPKLLISSSGGTQQRARSCSPTGSNRALLAES
jgi:hypothetical protein